MLVPSQKKANMSNLPLALVAVGAVPPGHLSVEPPVQLSEKAPEYVTLITNDLPATEDGSVIVPLPFKDMFWKVPLAKLIVNAVPAAGLKFVSVYSVTVGFVRDGALFNTTEPVPVLVVTPVPPFATFKVPATVIAPAEAVDGVKPVEPKVIDATPADPAAAQTAVVPLEVST